MQCEMRCKSRSRGLDTVFPDLLGRRSLPYLNDIDLQLLLEPPERGTWGLNRLLHSQGVCHIRRETSISCSLLLNRTQDIGVAGSSFELIELMTDLLTTSSTAGSGDLTETSSHSQGEFCAIALKGIRIIRKGLDTAR
jgi:hypothetical protein